MNTKIKRVSDPSVSDTTMDKKPTVTFYEKDHKYYAEDGKELISVTALLKKHGIAPKFYNNNNTEACNRGKAIHKDLQNFIEAYVNTNLIRVDAGSRVVIPSRLVDGKQINMSKEVELFARHLFSIMSAHGLKLPLYTEHIVNNDYLAGTIDLVYYKHNNPEYTPVIIDFKTGKTVDINYWSWQLSLYQYLLFCGTRETSDLLVFHFVDDRLDIIDIPRIPLEEIEYLIECDKEGTLYRYQELAPHNISNDLILKVENAHKSIAELEHRLCDLKETEKEIKNILIEEMKRYKLKTVESEYLKITYVGAYEKENFDIKKFKAEHPDKAQAYIKKILVNESLKLTAVSETQEGK